MDKLVKLFAKVLDVDECEITDKTSKGDTYNWDSFSHLILISEIERTFNVQLTMKEVENLKNFLDAKNLLGQKGIK